MINTKPNPKDYTGRSIEYWHARKNWLQEQKVKRYERLLDNACNLLGNIEFKKPAHEIECIEIVSGLLYDIESYRESIKNLKKKLKTPIRKWKRR